MSPSLWNVPLCPHAVNVCFHSQLQAKTELSLWICLIWIFYAKAILWKGFFMQRELYDTQTLVSDWMFLSIFNTQNNYVFGYFFFRNKCFLVCCKLSGYFQNTKWLFLIISSSFIVAFGGKGFADFFTSLAGGPSPFLNFREEMKGSRWNLD